MKDCLEPNGLCGCLGNETKKHCKFYAPRKGSCDHAYECACAELADLRFAGHDLRDALFNALGVVTLVAWLNRQLKRFHKHHWHAKWEGARCGEPCHPDDDMECVYEVYCQCGESIQIGGNEVRELIRAGKKIHGVSMHTGIDFLKD